MRFRRFSEAEKLCGNNYFSKNVCLFHSAKHQDNVVIILDENLLLSLLS